MKLLLACASCDDDNASSMSESVCTKASAMKKACFAKMKATAKEVGECTPRGSATDSGTVREALAKEAAGKGGPLRRLDLSSANIEATADGVRLIVAAPRAIDLATAHCTHIDGALTITLKKKAAKRIPVTAEVLKVVTAPIDAEAVETEAAAGESASEGEWEPLEAKPLDEKKDA